MILSFCLLPSTPAPFYPPGNTFSYKLLNMPHAWQNNLTTVRGLTNRIELNFPYLVLSAVLSYEEWEKEGENTDVSEQTKY